MKLAAASILILAASVALADPRPHAGFIGETVDGHDWLQSPQQSYQEAPAALGYKGQNVDRQARDRVVYGFDADFDMNGNDWDRDARVIEYQNGDDPLTRR